MSYSWGYGKDNGPHTWSKHYPVACGCRQSPINISTHNAKASINLIDNPLKLLYKPEKNLEFANTGHSVQASVAEESVISGGPLRNTYQLKQFHFHWGSEDHKGSEHTVDGISYAAELHLVHWNKDLYESFTEALDHENGLAVIGVFIQVGQNHDEFSAMTDVMKKIRHQNEKCFIDTFNPMNLLPADTTRYWTYPGSLTTPPCCECVTWIVMEDPVEVSSDQIGAFRQLTFEDAMDNNNVTPLCDNFRPPLVVGEREVLSSF